LATGAAASVIDTAGEGIKDSYSGLKALIRSKLAGQPKAETALVEYEDDSETFEKPLKKALVQEQVDQDMEIIEAAKKLMAQVNPQQVVMGKYNVQNTGNVQGHAQDDYQKVTMTFGNVPKEK
jgi:hypothetical protein